MSAASTSDSAAPDPGSPTDSRLSVLVWLAWRFLPPLGRADLRTLVRIGGACAYFAIPLTIALAARHLPGITAVSLLCLSVPGLPLLWVNAVRLGERRRGTALALRQVRLGRRAATITSLGQQLVFPLVGAIFGVLLILLLHRPLRSILPQASPLALAIKDASGGWIFAAPLAVLLPVALTTLLSGKRSKVILGWVGRTLSRFDRRATQPQPQ